MNSNTVFICNHSTEEEFPDLMKDNISPIKSNINSKNKEFKNIIQSEMNLIILKLEEFSAMMESP